MPPGEGEPDMPAGEGLPDCGQEAPGEPCYSPPQASGAGIDWDAGVSAAPKLQTVLNRAD